MRIRTSNIRNAENSCATHCNDTIGSRKSCLQSAEVKRKARYRSHDSAYESRWKQRENELPNEMGRDGDQ